MKAAVHVAVEVPGPWMPYTFFFCVRSWVMKNGTMIGVSSCWICESLVRELGALGLVRGRLVLVERGGEVLVVPVRGAPQARPA